MAQKPKKPRKMAFATPRITGTPVKDGTLLSRPRVAGRSAYSSGSTPVKDGTLLMRQQAYKPPSTAGSLVRPKRGPRAR